MNQYVPIWEQLKKAGIVEITVSKANAPAVERGIKKVKTAENTARKSVGLVGWSKLVFTRTSLSATHMKLTVSFLYSTAL